MSDVAELLSGLRNAPVLLESMVAEIPAGRLDARRGEGFWTIAQHVAHLAQVQPMLLARLERILNEEGPEFTPYFPDKDTEKEPEPEMSVAEALRVFRSERARQLALLEPLDKAAWAREALHPEYERYGLRILARHMMMHDLWHMYRMEELWLTRDKFLTNLEG